MGKEEIRVMVEIERSRIKREKAQLVLNKSLVLYFTFMVVAVMGFLFKYLDSFMLNVLVVVGVAVLFIGTIPYLFIVHAEEKAIDELEGGKH